MKKIICLLALLSTTFLHAEDKEEKPYFFYGQAQMVGFVPNAGVGIRGQWGVNGFDFSSSFVLSSIIVGTHVKGLYLLHPNTDGFYVGGGAGLLGVTSPMNELRGGVAATVESAIGYQWKNRKFLELNTITILEDRFDYATIPAITLGYRF